MFDIQNNIVLVSHVIRKSSCKVSYGYACLSSIVGSYYRSWIVFIGLVARASEVLTRRQCVSSNFYSRFSANSAVTGNFFTFNWFKLSANRNMTSECILVEYKCNPTTRYIDNIFARAVSATALFHACFWLTAVVCHGQVFIWLCPASTTFQGDECGIVARPR